MMPEPSVLLPPLRRALRRITGASILIMASSITAGCRHELPTRQPFVSGGTTGLVQVASTNPRELGLAAGNFQRSFTNILSALDAENPGSEVSKLNRVGGSARLPVTRSTFRALDMGRHYSGLTGGAYDYTTHELALLWSEDIPSPEALDTARARTGMRHVEVSDNGSIAVLAPGVAVTPGSLAPAYALDVGVVDLQRVMRGPYFISINGMSRREGVFPAGEVPSTPLYFYRRGEHTMIGQFAFPRHPALVARMHSRQTDARSVLIDPRTGSPTQNTRLAVVAGPLTVKAYALAEALLVLGVEEGGSILTNFPGHEVLVIPNREPLEIWLTPGFRDHFKPAEGVANHLVNWPVAVVMTEAGADPDTREDPDMPFQDLSREILEDDPVSPEPASE